MLALAEEVLLLALLEKKDSIRVPSSISLPYTLAGAVVADCILNGMINLEDGRLITVETDEPTGERVSASFLEKIQQSDKPRKLNYWVYALGVKRRLVSRTLLSELVEKGLLIEEKNVYQWEPAGENAGISPTPMKYTLKRGLRNAMYFEDALSERAMTCLTLLEAGDFLDHVFTKDEIVSVRKKLRKAKSTETYSQPFLDLLAGLSEAIAYAVASAVTA